MAPRDEAMAALRAELGGSGAEGLQALDDEELQALTSTVRAAKRHQSAALNAAAQQALGHVPALLRGPIRRILG
jgi:hypothetical protein